MLNVQLTPDYAIQSDANAQNFVVKRRRTVDPTQAPSYKHVEGAPVPPKRDVWEDAAYYPVSVGGLRASLDYVRFQEALSAESGTLAEFLTALQAETQRITTALSTAVETWPEITVERAHKDALDTSKKREISADTAA